MTDRQKAIFAAVEFMKDMYHGLSLKEVKKRRGGSGGYNEHEVHINGRDEYANKCVGSSKMVVILQGQDAIYKRIGNQYSFTAPDTYQQFIFKVSKIYALAFERPEQMELGV